MWLPLTSARAPTLRIVCFTLIVAAQLGLTHELRPGYLHVKHIEDFQFKVMWKQPTRNFRVLGLQPTFPKDCSTVVEPVTTVSTNGFVIDRFQLECTQSLIGREIGIEGLQRTLTDVYLRVELPTVTFTSLLRPEYATTVITSSPKLPTLGYLWVGIDHLLTGYDHLLFLLCLMYAVTKFTQLVKVITAFTIAHSLTMAFGVLGWIKIPQAPVEIVIAVSILFFAYTAAKGKEEVSWHKSWWVIFCFGLIHGAGFATALSDTGLERDDLIPALLLFNIGIEVAQIALIAATLLLIHMGRTVIHQLPMWLKQLPVSVSAGIAVYFICDRTWSTFTFAV